MSLKGFLPANPVHVGKKPLTSYKVQRCSVYFPWSGDSEKTGQLREKRRLTKFPTRRHATRELSLQSLSAPFFFVSFGASPPPPSRRAVTKPPNCQVFVQRNLLTEEVGVRNSN
jgi:hypothetical protein